MTTFANEETRNTARQYKHELMSQMFAWRGGGPALAAAAAAADAGTMEEGPSLLAALPPESNIRGIGYGAKITSGAGIDTMCVRVYVRAKQPKRNLAKFDIVPDDINGKPTDVIAVGEIVAAAPVPCGVSVGHVKVTAGTLGCLVKRAADPGKVFILSNNHVLADTNAAQNGDDIVQPGMLDGGKPPRIARLTDFEPLRFDNTPNLFDAAIAELDDPASVTPDVQVIGPIDAQSIQPAVYQSVRKHGRTTLHTVGIIMDIAADIPVSYGVGKTAAFHDQLAVSGVNGWFADRGDSGSVVVDAVTRRPVGLLVAVSQGLTYCNPIDVVLQRFGAEIAAGV